MEDLNILAHYGVLGMKWGVRRYQNADGTLTNAGKKRYSAAKAVGKIVNDSAKPKGGPETPKPPKNAKVDGQQTIKRSGVIENLKSQAQRESERQKRRDNRERGTLSDDELRQKINRLQMEQQLDKLTRDQVNRGQEYVTGILKDIGKKVAVTAGAGALLYGLKVAASGEPSNFDFGDLGNAVFNGGAKKK